MYTEQWERINRWLKRVESEQESQQDYVDFLWAFFQNCWHFKDWIKNDPETPKKVVDSIEGDINNYEALRICADLANRSKHLTLRPGWERHDKDPQVRGHIKVGIEEDLPRGTTTSKVTWDYVVHLDDGTDRPVLDIAQDALKGWVNLIQQYGISI